MSMYECTFCGGEYSSYPEVIIYINRFEDGDRSFANNILEEKFRELALEYKYNPYSSTKDQEEIFKKFDSYIMMNTLWFCSKKCAQSYLTHELPEWELDKLGE